MSPSRPTTSSGGSSAGRAFTLTELLIVMVAIILLASIVVPSFMRAAELGRSVICKHQLRQMGTAMWTPGVRNDQVQRYSGMIVPDYTRWDDLLYQAKSIELTICPSDRATSTDPLEGIRDLYVHQVSWQYGYRQDFDTSMHDILTGGAIDDDQFIMVYQGATYAGANPICSPDYLLEPVGGTLGNNQLAMAMGHSTIVVTIRDHYVLVEEFIRNPDWWTAYGHMTGSDHFLCKGPMENWESEKVRDLTGRNHKLAAEPYANLYRISYGMNSLVSDTSPSQSQLWLVEYTDRDIILHDDPNRPKDQPFNGNLADGEVMARHLGNANVLFVDGNIKSMTKSEIQVEYEKPVGMFRR